MNIEKLKTLFAEQKDNETGVFYLHHFGEYDNNGELFSRVQINRHVINDWDNTKDWELLSEKLSVLQHDPNDPCGNIPRFYGESHKKFKCRNYQTPAQNIA